MFGAWVLLALRDIRYRPKFSWLAIAVASFIGIIALADFFGESPFKSIWSNFERMEGLVSLLHFGAYFIVVGSVLNTQRLWDKFFHISIGVSIFITLYGLLQLAGEFTIHQGGVRLDATFGNASYLAIYLVFHIFFTSLFLLRDTNKSIHSIITSWLVGFGLFIGYYIYLFSYSNYLDGLGQVTNGLFFVSIVAFAFLIFVRIKEKKDYYFKKFIRPLLYVSVLVLQIIILYNTATRGAILGFLGGSLLTALLIALFERERVSLKKVAIGIVVGVVIFIGGFLSLKNTSFIQDSPVLSRFASISLQSDGNARFMIWGMAIEGVKDRPLLGWGQENFNYVFNKYYDPRLYAQESWFDRVHNIVLDWLVAGGILGLFSFLSILVFFFYYLWRKEGSELSVVDKSVLTGLLAGYLFHNFFVFDNLISYMYLFTLLAYVYSLTGREITEESFLKKEIDRNVLHKIITPVVIIFTIFSLYFFNAKGLATGYTLLNALGPQEGGIEQNIKKFEKAILYNSIGRQEAVEQFVLTATQSLGFDIPDETKINFFNSAKTELEKLIKDRPDDARLRLFASSFYGQFGLYDLALIHIEEAKKSTPKKQTVYFQSGAMYLAKEEYQKAFEEFEYAYNLEPSYEEAQANYAVSASYIDREDVVDKMIDLFFKRHGESGGKIDINGKLIISYINLGKYDKIRAMWQKAVKLDPENIQLRLSLAATYTELGQRAKAIEEIRTIIEMNPNFKDEGEGYIREIELGKNFTGN